MTPRRTTTRTFTPNTDDPGLIALQEIDRGAGARHCRQCGCTDTYACPLGCAWAEVDLCSRCA